MRSLKTFSFVTIFSIEKCSVRFGILSLLGTKSQLLPKICFACFPNAKRTLHKEWMCLLHTVTPLRISNEKLVNLRKRRNIFEKALGCTDDVVAIQRVKSLWWSNTALEEEENKYKRYKFCYVPTYCIILSCIETIEEWSQLAGIKLRDQVVIRKSCHSI